MRRGRAASLDCFRRTCQPAGVTRRHVSSLANIDLNLLVILRELLREQNVTRAAERVGITQPAASAALARLRRHFGDELLERSRNGFVLTPLGTQLAAQVEPLCLGMENLFAPEPPFDPAQSDREFRILTNDYVLASFGEELSRALFTAAPDVRLHVSVAKGRLPEDLPEALRSIDGIVSAPKAEFKDAEIRGEEIFRDRWVCVVAADNDSVGSEMHLGDLERLPWVVPNQPEQIYPASSPLAPLMAQLTVRPRVAVRVDSSRPPRTSWPGRIASPSCRNGWRRASRTAPTCGSSTSRAPRSRSWRSSGGTAATSTTPPTPGSATWSPPQPGPCAHPRTAPARCTARCPDRRLVRSDPRARHRVVPRDDEPLRRRHEQVEQRADHREQDDDREQAGRVEGVQAGDNEVAESSLPPRYSPTIAPITENTMATSAPANT